MNDDVVVIKNAIIDKIELGFFGEGEFLSCDISINFGNSIQKFGGFTFGVKHKMINSCFGMEFIRRLLIVFDKNRLNELEGIAIRVKKLNCFNGKIIEIGHYLNDEWFNPTLIVEELKG